MSSYGEWFNRFQNNPQVMAETKAIQERKKKEGYDPNLTTIVKRTENVERSVLRSGVLADDQVSMEGIPGLENLFTVPKQQREEPKDPDKQYCSFCGDLLEKVHTTSEKKAKIKVFLEPIKDEQGNIELIRKVKNVTQIRHACPKCCLKIQKPIIVSRV